MAAESTSGGWPFPSARRPPGKIFVDAAFIRNCTLQYLSRAGACLRVHEPYDIPEMFDLVLETLGIKKGCRIVWRSKDKIGVTFEANTDLVMPAKAGIQ